MVLNIFKTLANKSDPQPRSNSRLGSDYQLRYGGSSTSATTTTTGGSRLASCTLSAPSSPSLVKSAIPSLVKRPSSMASSRHPPPPANICVEKGRIEFVKSPVVAATTTVVRPQSPPQASSSPSSSIPSAAKMGTKIFRPAAVRKSPEGSVSSKLPPVSNRESKIPVVSRTAAAAVTSSIPKPPDVVMRIPRTMPAPPSVMSRSRETSPAGEGIPVSPNLIRWRAKLSSSSSSPSSSSSAKTKATATQQQQQQQQQQVNVPEGLVALSSLSKPSAPADKKKTDAASEPNQMQLLNLHYEVKRLEETVQTLLPLRHQQTALIQSYEERLAESQSRLATAEAEVARLKERLGRVESSEADHRQLVQQLETDKAAMAGGQEQQRQVFDKCLDEIANHVFQALISQKNLQGECRRLRSQVSDLEQRNVALNLLLTQSLRDSMQLETGSRKLPGTIPCCTGEMTKSHSYDCGAGVGGAENQRDSVCSTVSDSELTQRNCSSILAAVDWANCASSKGRLLVSKDSNWTLASTATVASSSSSTSSRSSSQTALMAVTGTGDLQSPVERAEKLLAVLKHRLFSAQLNCGFTGHEQTDSAPETPSAPPVTPVPSARPNSLALDQATTTKTATTPNKKSDPPGTPSVRALVEKMEAKRASSSAAVLAVSPPRPPLPPAAAIAAVANIRVNPATVNCPSKDEGYSTLSSDVQVDSSSSSSSFIASGCSSPATLRRSGSTGSNPSRRSSGSSPSVVTTRSLPMINKRKPAQPMRPPPQAPQPQVNRCQETAALDQLREEEDDVETPLPSTGQKRHQATEWAVGAVGVELGTLCEDWSAGESNTTGSDEGEAQTSLQQLEGSKWTSDSDLFKEEEEEWKTLGNDGEGHPLRRTRAHVRLSSSDVVVVLGGGVTNNIDASATAASPPKASSSSTTVNYSERELEDWILHSSSEEMLLQQQNDATLSAISENSYESDQDDDDDDDDHQLFMPGPSSSDEAADNEEEEEEEEVDEEEEENVDTEFTPDYYRLVKFESNPSLANSERGEPRPAADDVVPPDRQVALQTVLDFIAEQQRYCAQRQSQDEAQRSGLNSSSPPPPSSSSSLLQLRQFVTTDDDDADHRLDSDREDGSFSTTWMPVRGQAVLDSLLRSSSSSSSSSCSRCCSPLDPRPDEETCQGGKL